MIKQWGKQTKNPQHWNPINSQLHIYILQDYQIMSITKTEACEILSYDQAHMTKYEFLAFIYYEVLPFQHHFNAQLPGMWSNTLPKYFWFLEVCCLHQWFQRLLGSCSSQKNSEDIVPINELRYTSPNMSTNNFSTFWNVSLLWRNKMSVLVSAGCYNK